MVPDSESDETFEPIAIVLASGSPRRRELTERIGFEPLVRPSDIPERIREDESGTAYTARLAEQKAEDVADSLSNDPEPPHWLLAADTVVELEGDVLEKPEDRADAFEMLTAMSGGWHRVVTSFCWLNRRNRNREVETVATDVRLRDLEPAFVESYVATGEPMDKAGAYGIQDLGGLLVRRLEGSYFNVVGLPIAEVVEVLEDLEAFEIHPLLKGAAEPRIQPN